VSTDQTEAMIADAMRRSIENDEHAAVTGNIDDMRFAVCLLSDDYDFAEVSDGVVDIWGQYEGQDFRLLLIAEGGAL
jgi:hypothetical protein